MVTISLCANAMCRRTGRPLRREMHRNRARAQRAGLGGPDTGAPPSPVPVATAPCESLLAPSRLGLLPLRPPSAFINQLNCLVFRVQFKVTTHDFHGNCVALDHKPPQELLRFGQDLHAYLSHGEAAPPAALKPGLDVSDAGWAPARLVGTMGGEGEERDAEAGSRGIDRGREGLCSSGGSRVCCLRLAAAQEPHGDAKDVLSGFADAYQAKMETGFLGLTASLSSADSGPRPPFWPEEQRHGFASSASMGNTSPWSIGTIRVAG